MSDVFVCQTNNLVIGQFVNGATYKWNTGETTPTINVSKSGLYYFDINFDDITLVRDSINVTIEKTTVTLGNDTSICQDDYFTINLDTTYEDYLWNDGDKNSYKEIHNVGEYFFTAKKLACNIKSDTLIVSRTLIPRIIEPMKDTLICENSPLVLSINADGNDGLIWHNFHTDTFTTVSTGGTYWVKAFNKCGEVIDSVKVSSENCDCYDFIPNVFTPNGDGVNDNFSFQSNCIPSNYYNLKVYDRWGTKLFDSNNHEEKWDGMYKGKLCPTGVYSYILQVQYKHDKEKQSISRRIKIIH